MCTNQYLKNAHLPEYPVHTVLLDRNVSKVSINTLNKLGIDVILSQEINSLYPGVSTHPDMQIHHLENNRFVCEPTVAKYYKNTLKNSNICSGGELIEKYPYDILYNAVKIGNTLLHNLTYTDKAIKEYFSDKNVSLVNVKQGYTKCSVCVLNEQAVITSDKLIARAVSEVGIDALWVEPYDIILEGVSHGLIGGICGKIDKNVLAVNGDVSRLSCGKSFLSFCEKHDIKVVSLNDDTPVDIGSIMPLMY